MGVVDRYWAVARQVSGSCNQFLGAWGKSLLIDWVVALTFALGAGYVWAFVFAVCLALSDG